MNKDAATYLILAQNAVQTSFEFEVLDLDDLSAGYGFQLPKYRRSDPSEDFVAWVQCSLDIFRRAINSATADYGVQPVLSCYWIVITEEPMPGHFYGDAAEGLTVISIADWKRAMAPPSVLEFILRQTHVGVMNYCDTGQSHVETRGCVSDFNTVLSDARQHVLLGFLCSTCASMINIKLGESAVEAFRLLLSRSWLGTTEQSDSVAGVLRKVFGYDLYVTRGFAANWRETTASELLKTLPQEIIKGLFYLLLAALLFYLGLKSK